MNNEAQNLSFQALQEDLQAICDAPNGKGSAFFESKSAGFKECSRHYLTSSSDMAAAAVQPVGEEDLAKIIQVIAKHRFRFAVKSGGHSMAPAFSSTNGGIQISMARFDKITYDPSTTLLQVGAGCLWGAVYKKTSHLNPPRCVVGGVNPAVGVGGFLLGGGYSLKSSRLGLAVDNVKAFRLVTPQGAILEVSDEDTGEKKDLYNALRGGANNFGIVTHFTLYTHEQKETYGAVLVINNAQENENEVKHAIMDHILHEKRKNAAIEVAFRYHLLAGHASPEYTISATCVFDAPKPSKESEVPFAAFRDIVKKSWEWKRNPAGWDPVLSALDQHHFVAPQVPDSDSEEAVSAFNQNVEQASDLGFRQMPFNELHRLSEHTYKVASFRAIHMTFIQVNYETDSDDNDAILQSIQPALSKPLPKVLDEMGTPDSGFQLGVVMLNTSPKFIPSAVPNGTVPREPVPHAAIPRRANGKKPARRLSIQNLGETNMRGRFACIMVSTYTEALVEAVARQAERASGYMMDYSGRQVLIEVWPFHSSIFDTSPPDAAWPHNKDDPYSPLIASFLWEDADHDDFWLDLMKECLDELLKVAIQEKCAREDMPRYLNTSLESVPVEKIYGKAQLEKLGRVRARYDPEDVMSLTGGFRIPLNK